MTPYIVTTTRPDERPSRVGHADDTRTTSRRAVATLDEAHAALFYDLKVASGHAYAVPEQGGSVSLPDGTTITVERHEWADLVRWVGLKQAGSVRLAELAESGLGHSQEQIIDAYNRANGGEA